MAARHSLAASVPSRVTTGLAAALVIGLLADPNAALAATPNGSQFQVNTYTTLPNGQVTPRIASDASGNFVVVWQSYGSPSGDSSGFSVQGQRYDVNGSAIGTQFQVNTAIRRPTRATRQS